MDNQIPEDPYRILARERSHEDARQTVATNRMLVQSLVIINGGAAIAVLAYYGAHNASGPGKSAALLTIILYCLGVFTATMPDWPHILCRADAQTLKRHLNGCRDDEVFFKLFSTPECHALRGHTAFDS
jgi:hypothetical protein